MTNKEQLIKEFREKFGDRFTQVARYADKGWDEAYGNELARIEIDAEAFLLSAFDAGRASGIEEVKEAIKTKMRAEEIKMMDSVYNAGWNDAVDEVETQIAFLTPSSSKDN